MTSPLQCAGIKLLQLEEEVDVKNKESASNDNTCASHRLQEGETGVRNSPTTAPHSCFLMLYLNFSVNSHRGMDSRTWPLKQL